MNPKLIRRLFLLVNFTILPFTSFAWHSNGHSTAGAIAYYYLLKNNPTVLSKILATLKQHYWYNTSHWQSRLSQLPADQQDVGLFMLASTYPDDAKSDPGNIDGDEVHHQWHFINIPFNVPGSGIIGPAPASPNAEEEIAILISTIPREADSPQKAKDLAWLFHLIEDIHQPLHCAVMFNQTFNTKNGDLGGNFVIIHSINRNSNLHSYWDDLIGGQVFTNWPTIGNQLFLKYPEIQLPEIASNTTPTSWINQESYPDALQYAYGYGQISGTEVNKITLSANYQSTAEALAERRVTLAGIRLAKLLETLYS